MKIKFYSDDELPPNKMIELSSMMIVVRTVFHSLMNVYLNYE